jgi:cytochrome c553
MVATQMNDTTVRLGSAKTSKSYVKSAWMSFAILTVAAVCVMALVSSETREISGYSEQQLKEAVLKPSLTKQPESKKAKKCSPLMMLASDDDCDKIDKWLGSGKFAAENAAIEKQKNKGEAILEQSRAMCKQSVETDSIAAGYKRRAIAKRKKAMLLREEKATLIYKYRGMYNRRKQLLTMYAEAREDSAEASEAFEDIRRETDTHQDKLDDREQKFRMACSQVREAKKLVAMDPPQNRNLSHEVQLHFAQKQWRKLRHQVRSQRRMLRALNKQLKKLKEQDSHREDLKEAYRTELRELSSNKHNLLVHIRRVCKARSRWLKKWKKLRAQYKSYRRQSRKERRTCKMLKLKGRTIIDNVQRTWPKLVAQAKASMTQLHTA